MFLDRQPMKEGKRPPRQSAWHAASGTLTPVASKPWIQPYRHHIHLIHAPIAHARNHVPIMPHSQGAMYAWQIVLSVIVEYICTGRVSRCGLEAGMTSIAHKLGK